MAKLPATKQTKRSKVSVEFEDPAQGPHHCGECKHFNAPSSCALVRGKIDAEDWCKLFTAK